jgi:CRISPR-associated protein Cas1
MIGGVLEIAQNDRHLSLYRGFVCIKDHQDEIGRVALDDLTVVMLTADQISFSKAVVTALMERGIPLVSCGRNYHPDGVMLPYGTHYQQAGVLAQQIALSEPRRKRLWQQVVQAKITQQRQVLLWYPANDKAGGADALQQLVSRVKSGDPENTEAQAARLYWPALFGADFRRDHTASGRNSFLNYGYAVVRAATARALVGAGLTPALGLHHHQAGNAFALADDLMEPFRPMVDALVKEIECDYPGSFPEILSVADKRRIVAVLQWDCDTLAGRSPLINVLHSMAHTLVLCLHDHDAALLLPPAFPLRGASCG